MPKRGYYKEEVLKLRKVNPNLTLALAFEALPGLTESNFYKILRENPLEQSEDSKVDSIVKKNHDQNSANFDNTSKFIDDPDELLMSVAVRELNKPHPDPRWASILINCRKENITIKSEVIDQLQRLPTKALTEMLKKQSGKSLLVE